MKEIPTDMAQKIALEYVRKMKNTERVDIAAVEQKSGAWVFRGTCPIDLEGHPWAEKFEVVVDVSGKVKSSYFSLL